MTISEKIKHALDTDGVAILPPMDVFESIAILKEADICVNCTMLDPWYNKGFGGELPTSEYDDFITRLLNQTGEISDLIICGGSLKSLVLMLDMHQAGFTWLHG